MKISNIALKFIMLLCAIFITAAPMSAQTSGDRLYNQGLKFQKTMTIKAQRSAISKFQSAKKLYDSSAKKAQCDQAIEVSNGIIRSLSSGKSSKEITITKNEEAKPEPTLSLSNSSFDLNMDSDVLRVTVTTNQNEWDVATVTNSDGSSFLNVRKSGDNAFEILCPVNESCSARSQKIIVTASNIRQELTVNQSGRNVTLDVSEKIIKVKEKGGDKKIKIKSDSDEKFAQNEDANWYVFSKPEWVEVTIDEKEDKNKNSLTDKGKELTNKALGFIGMKKKDENPYLIETKAIIFITPLVAGTFEAHTGRQGEVVIVSGDKSVTIHVNQTGK